ncbi:inactive ubiquitin carboxyl-terminal hydrolase MINDY-4B [Teleopsis dalmanni]|uniref:inactive ubiquitin carboxyl-terminal hydrolase MINDY-4B n=1 Tax=Teleopsis dalmanni TaxID=139649 RepID=UPI000D32B89F|nr:inactive ubiquitin carboxyl-terminal hydrolase MINDY-4B [Teleopsis dalmanni]
MNKSFLAQGGTPISAELATELRQLVFGTSAVPMRAEWTQTPFIYGAPKEELPYGLRSPRNATRGLLSVVQAFALKYFLFSRKARSSCNTDLLSPSVEMQRLALVTAMVEILRNIADKGKVIMVLHSPDDEPFVPHTVTYFHDSVTEKLYVFTLSPHDELEFFIKRNFNQFTEEDTPGTLLFLYSAVLTRTMGKIRTDLDSNNQPLTLPTNEEGSLMIVTLLISGRATPHIHNGVINVGDENSYAVPQYGILSRCTIGLLLWENECGQARNSSSSAPVVMRQPGSRLKTPTSPIWVTSCAGHFGVLFNQNPELLRNYHAESRFDVMYYSCSGHQLSMTIDNRTYNEMACSMLERQSPSSENNSLSGRGNKDEQNGRGNSVDIISQEENTLNTPLQRLIHTKWEEAHIRFHGQPSLLSYLFSTNQ